MSGRILNERNPVLLTGSHRSGSTWVGGVLSLSPELVYVQEIFHPKNAANRMLWGSNLRYFYQCVTDANADQFERAIRRAVTLRPRMASPTSFIRAPRTALGYLRHAIRFHVSRLAHRRALIKDPYALLSAEWMALKCGVRLVLLVRHPAAFVSSLKRMNWIPDIPKLLRFSNWSSSPISEFEGEFLAAVDQGSIEKCSVLWKGLHHVIDCVHGNVAGSIVVRHEDLALQPEKEFRTLFESLGLTMTEHTLDFIRRSTASENPTEVPDRRSQVSSRNSAALVRSWKTRLTAGELATIRRITEPVASRFYADSEW